MPRTTDDMETIVVHLAFSIDWPHLVYSCTQYIKQTKFREFFFLKYKQISLPSLTHTNISNFYFLVVAIRLIYFAPTFDRKSDHI